MRLLQRLVCGGAVLSLLIIAASLNAQERPTTPGKPLQAAAGDKMLIGAAIPAQAVDDPALSRLIAEQFNCLTAENDFKPGSLQPEPGKFTFERADKIADFAQQHGMKLIGHTLVWHQQSPAFLFEDGNKQPLPREKALENLRQHIDTVVKHYKGKVHGWDVVNEAVADAEPYLRDTPARKAIGDDYVVMAFRFAQEADPDVELYYNDYNIEAPYKREKGLKLIRELKAAGVRLDGVGIQGHWLIDTNLKEIEEGIRAYADEGLKVMITELDVDPLPRGKGGAGADVSATEREGLDPYKNGLPAAMQQKLAARYRDLFKLFRKHKVTRVTFWGTHDGSSWLNSWPVKGRTNHPLLWDRDLQPKPALHAVISALEGPSSPEKR